MSEKKQLSLKVDPGEYEEIQRLAAYLASTRYPPSGHITGRHGLARVLREALTLGLRELYRRAAIPSYSEAWDRSVFARDLAVLYQEGRLRVQDGVSPTHPLDGAIQPRFDDVWPVLSKELK